MKKILKLFSIVLFIIAVMLLAVALSACDNSTVRGTDGLAYKLNSDGQSYSVVGMGDATDKEIVIASKYNDLPVTAIADSAFANYSFLTSVKIPNSVVQIGSNAFANCTGIDSIVIPDSVTEICESAFEGCSGLTSVTIGEDVVSVGDSAFGECEELVAVNWNAVNCLDVNSDYGSIFTRCYKLSRVEFGQKVKSIPSYLLINCYGITSIYIPDNVTTIGRYAFGYCIGLSDITIPSNVAEIGNSAFCGCRSLETVHWNAIACTSAGSYKYGDFGDQTIFRDCSKLEKIIIGDNVTEIPPYAFYGCNKVKSVVIPNNVTLIGTSVFGKCEDLMNVTIGNSVTEIGAGAFYGCDKLLEVCNLSNLTITIGSTGNGDIAYYAKHVYTSANGKSYLTTTDDGCILYEDDNEICILGYCGEQDEITLPIKTNGKEYVIYNRAFYENRYLSSVTIPDGVTSIGNSAFYNCSGLKSIVIPNSVTTIGDSAFYNCSIESATIPMSALSSISISKLQTLVFTSGSSIDRYAFFGNRNLTSITIPDSVTTIGTSAFCSCSELTSVTIGNSVTTIGDGAFWDCGNLNSVYYTGDIAGWCNINFDDPSANPLIYAHNLYIDNNLATELVIPNTVTEIKSYTFYLCESITSITISESVTSIGTDAFYRCEKVTEIIFEGSVDQWNAITKESGWESFLSATKVICSDGEVSL